MIIDFFVSIWNILKGYVLIFGVIYILICALILKFHMNIKSWIAFFALSTISFGILLSGNRNVFLGI